MQLIRRKKWFQMTEESDAVKALKRAVSGELSDTFPDGSVIRYQRVDGDAKRYQDAIDDLECKIARQKQRGEDTEYNEAEVVRVTKMLEGTTRYIVRSGGKWQRLGGDRYDTRVFSWTELVEALQHPDVKDISVSLATEWSPV